MNIISIQCLHALVPVFPYCYIQDFDALFTACTKALEGSTYEIRLETAKLMGLILSSAMDPAKHNPGKPVNPDLMNPISFDTALYSLSNVFLRGMLNMVSSYFRYRWSRWWILEKLQCQWL